MIKFPSIEQFQTVVHNVVKRLFPRYRIINVGEKYISQVRTSFGWKGIDRYMDLWGLVEYQYEYCRCDTLETARIVLNNYKMKVNPHQK